MPQGKLVKINEGNEYGFYAEFEFLDGTRKGYIVQGCISPSKIGSTFSFTADSSSVIKDIHIVYDENNRVVGSSRNADPASVFIGAKTARQIKDDDGCR